MTGQDALERFLQTDPADVGCEQALHILHVYAELVLGEFDTFQAASGPTAESVAARRYPGVAAHLLACGPCAEDLRGLLIAAEA